MTSAQSTQHVPAIATSDAAKWSYLSLFYSLFYFFGLYAGWSRYQTHEVVLAFVGYAIFIALYLRCLHVSGKQARLPVAGLIVLAFGVASFHVGANALFGYAAFLSSYYFQPRTAWYYLVFNVTAQLLAAFAFELVHIYFLGPSLGVTLSLFLFGRFSQKDFIFQNMEQQKNQQIEQLAAIAERERIARDMHDLLGHTLSSLALKSELAEKLIARGNIEQAKSEIEQVADLSRTTLSEVRAAVTGLKQKGLRPTVDKLCAQLTDLGFKTETEVQISTLNARTESTLIMLCKEWITNILRHSKGNMVSISLVQKGERIHLQITDNGEVANITAGNGIDGMKARIAELKGEFSLHIDSGVALDVTIPATA